MAELRADHPRPGGAKARPRSPSASPTPPQTTFGRLVRFHAQDGVLLAARIFEAAGTERLPLLCLPGLSRNSRDFAALGQHFARHAAEPRTVVAVDYRGRGDSEPDRNWRNYRPAVEADDALAAAALFGVEEAIVIGTSRGGIVAMLLGAVRPGLLAGVVLNDIGPVIEGTGLVRIKKSLGAARSVADWAEAAAVLRKGAGTQFPGLSQEDWDAMARAYFAETRWGLAPQFDRNLLRALADVNFSDEVPAIWPQFMSLARVPVLAIRGEHSDILSVATLAEMVERHPDCATFTVQGQGHAPLLRDAPTLARIAAFAKRCDARRAA